MRKLSYRAQHGHLILTADFSGTDPEEAQIELKDIQLAKVLISQQMPGLLLRALAKKIVLADDAPIPMLLWCPMCHVRHVDVGDFATKPHHTHACQRCGVAWRPAIACTVGVQFLPGFKDDLLPSPATTQR